MKNLFSTLLLLFVSLLIIDSCAPKQELNYMKNIDELATEASIKSAASTLQPGDQLSIMISADDMEVVAPFNQNISNSDSPNYNMINGSQNINRVNVSQNPTYVVKEDGTINFPILGLLDTTNKTKEEFAQYLQNRMKKYVVNPIVNINIINFKVTVLGQVNRPATYTVPDGQATLLTALGLAGDLTKYGERDNVLVVRNENGQITKTRIDLTKADFINSPFYQIKQNDVIFVSGNPTVTKTSRLDPNAGIYISVASIVVTILALVFK